MEDQPMNARSLLLAMALAGTARGAFALDCYTEIDPIYYQTDVRSLIHAVTRADVERIRGELVAYIWKAPSLPEALPEVTADVGNPFQDLTDPPNVRRVDLLTVSMDDFVSHMYLFLPERSRRQLMIVHQGHGNDLASTISPTPSASSWSAGTPSSSCTCRSSVQTRGHSVTASCTIRCSASRHRR
jgi:hypothetical protein